MGAGRHGGPYRDTLSWVSHASQAKWTGWVPRSQISRHPDIRHQGLIWNNNKRLIWASHASQAKFPETRHKPTELPQVKSTCWSNCGRGAFPTMPQPKGLGPTLLNVFIPRTRANNVWPWRVTNAGMQSVCVETSLQINCGPAIRVFLCSYLFFTFFFHIQKTNKLPLNSPTFCILSPFFQMRVYKHVMHLEVEITLSASDKIIN